MTSIQSTNGKPLVPIAIWSIFYPQICTGVNLLVSIFTGPPEISCTTMVLTLSSSSFRVTRIICLHAETCSVVQEMLLVVQHSTMTSSCNQRFESFKLSKSRLWQCWTHWSMFSNSLRAFLDHWLWSFLEVQWIATHWKLLAMSLGETGLIFPVITWLLELVSWKSAWEFHSLLAVVCGSGPPSVIVRPNRCEVSSVSELSCAGDSGNKATTWKINYEDKTTWSKMEHLLCSQPHWYACFPHSPLMWGWLLQWLEAAELG